MSSLVYDEAIQGWTNIRSVCVDALGSNGTRNIVLHEKIEVLQTSREGLRRAGGLIL